MSIESQVRALAAAIGTTLQDVKNFAAGKYDLPADGIPSSQMSSDVRTSLQRADVSVPISSFNKEYLGLNFVDNTADASKPISILTQQALDAKAALNHTHTAAQISDASASGRTVLTQTDLGLARAAINAADAGIQIRPGTGLTGGGDLTATRTLSLGAEALASLAKADSAVQPAGLTKAAVGLGNVDNTSDVNKPVSTAQQTALNAKAATARVVGTSTGLQGGGDLSADRTLSLTPAVIASLAKADAATPQVIIPGSNSTPVYRRIAVLNSGSSDSGGNISFLFSGLGNYGSSARGTVLAHLGIRAANNAAGGVQMWSWGAAESGIDIGSFYVRTISDFQYEFWYLAPQYTMDSRVTLLSKSDTATLTMDSASTTAPSGLFQVYATPANLDQTARTAAAAAVQQAQLLPLRRMDAAVDAWSADKVVAQANSRVNYEDATASTETWSALSNWKYTSGKLQVSGGRLYAGDNVGGTPYGAVQVFDVGVYTRAIAKATVVIPTVASGTTDYGDLIVGFSNENNVVPTTAGRQAKGVTFQLADDGTTQIQLWDMGTRTQIGNYSPGTYYVTLSLDPYSIGVTVTQANSTYSINGVIPLNGMAVKSRYVFVNDRRTTTGKSIGQFGLMTALSSHRSRAGTEDLSPFWAHITDTGTYRLHIALPKNYDSRKPAPVVMAFHGAGTNALNYGSGNNNNNTAMMSAFTNAGYIVVSASLNSSLTTWGSDAGLAVYEYAYQYLKSFFSIGQVVFFANSMGGIESLLTLARNVIPCSAWIATVPTVSLRNNYEDNYSAQIGPSYGVASDGSDYAAKTAGHDPFLMDPAVFRGLPTMVIISTDDDRVLPARNWNLMEPKITPYLPDYQRINVTGGHQPAGLSTNVPAMLAFAQKYVKQPLS